LFGYFSQQRYDIIPLVVSPTHGKNTAMLHQEAAINQLITKTGAADPWKSEIQRQAGSSESKESRPPVMGMQARFHRCKGKQKNETTK
jgi:hypothetical protein